MTGDVREKKEEINKDISINLSIYLYLSNLSNLYIYLYVLLAYLSTFYLLPLVKPFILFI